MVGNVVGNILGKRTTKDKYSKNMPYVLKKGDKYVLDPSTDRFAMFDTKREATRAVKDLDDKDVKVKKVSYMESYKYLKDD